MKSFGTAILLFLTSVCGLLSLLFPFSRTPVPGQALPFLLMGFGALLIGTTLLYFRAEGRWSAMLVAVLAVLSTISGALRLIPMPTGFTAAFLLPLLGGFAYGPTFGFLLGCFTILVSALFGAGVGPWLPYQILLTGWVGLGAGIIRTVIPGRKHGRVALLSLGIYGALSGFVFGLLMNLWFWPTLAPASVGTSPDLITSLSAYGVFYVATSSWWDATRALGNLVLILAFGPAILRSLERFRERFSFTRTRFETERNAPQ